MMDPNPKTRYTIDQCLNSSWLKEEQSDQALDGIADEIRKYQARKKMRVPSSLHFLSLLSSLLLFLSIHDHRPLFALLWPPIA